MKEEFYISLKEKLEEQHKFPTLYMFKFIIPADNHRLALVEALFGPEAQVTTRQSSSNKFISISAKEVMITADSIIAVYKKAEQIEGIVSL
ncbi:MAG: DUF493 family protein [Vicingaceae bacterium]|nr:DUF493 family protein [Vicingaceae bacterium]